MNSSIAFKVVEHKITPRRALALALSFIFLILPMARAVDDIVIGPDGIPGIDRNAAKCHPAVTENAEMATAR